MLYSESMLVPMENLQDLVDALSYLQHHLQELTKRQNLLENNINTALACKGTVPKPTSNTLVVVH